MTSKRARDPQRGNSLVLAMIVMAALATIAELTVVTVQGSLKASTTDRTQTVATAAAESGIAAAMDYLRTQGGDWSSLIGDPLQGTNQLPFLSNNKPPGSPDNLFSPDQPARYQVFLLNNPIDTQTLHPNTIQTVGSASPAPPIPPPPPPPSPAPPPPTPILVLNQQHAIIHSVGYGPQNSMTVIEVEVVMPGGSFNYLGTTYPTMALLGWHVAL